MVDILTADYNTILQALEARLRIDAAGFIPLPLSQSSTAFAESTRDNAQSAATFYRGCQEALCTPLAAAQSVLDSCNLVLARAHNDASLVARLPVELVQDIFEHVTTDETRPDNMHSFLWVFHRWRCIALSYAGLWSNIHIKYSLDDSFNASFFGAFEPTAPSDLHILRNHIARSQNALLCVRIDILEDIPDDQKRRFQEAVSTLYAHSRRFRVLHIHATHHTNIVLPLPKDLPNIATLDVEIPEYRAPQSLVVDGAILRPTYLRLAGSISPYFHLIDSHRLGHLAVSYMLCRVDYLKSLRNLLLNAQAVKTMDLRLEVMQSRSPLAHIDDSRLQIPSIEQLDLLCDPEALEHLFHPPNLVHLRLQQMPRPHNEVGARTVSIVDDFIGELSSLESLAVLWWPHRHRKVPQVDTWFSGKKDKLIAALVSFAAFMQASPGVFKPGETPSLRYLVVQDSQRHNERVTYEESYLSLFGQRMTEILDASPQLRIMLVHGHSMHRALQTGSIERTSRVTLLPNARAGLVSVEEVARAHKRGVDDCFAPYREELV